MDSEAITYSNFSTNVPPSIKSEHIVKYMDDVL